MSDEHIDVCRYTKLKHTVTRIKTLSDIVDICVEIMKAGTDARLNTRDEFKLSELKGYIECARAIKDGCIELWDAELPKCGHCGTPIRGRKRLYCDDKCRDEYYRSTGQRWPR